MTKLRDVAKEAKSARPDKLNAAASRKETVHAGGTPLFDEATGERLSPAEYALRKHFKWAKKEK